ncbi:MAG: hypothetical protein IT233_12560 [Bacteroidia bacterium]|nr:hypothetical protein [Bacteroidia bacterium]
MNKNQSKLLRFVLILYSILSLASTVYLIYDSHYSPPEPIYEKTKQELHDIKQYLKSKDSLYDRSLDSLKSVSDSLEQVIHKNDQRLEGAKEYVIQISRKMDAFKSSFELDTMRMKDEQVFDSLSLLCNTFRIASFARDSLCDNEISSLNCFLEVKDAIINMKDSLLVDYKSTTARLLLTTEELNESLGLMQNKLRRSKRAAKVLAVSAVFLSGFIISQHLKYE